MPILPGSANDILNVFPSFQFLIELINRIHCIFKYTGRLSEYLIEFLEKVCIAALIFSEFHPGSIFGAMIAFGIQ